MLAYLLWNRNLQRPADQDNAYFELHWHRFHVKHPIYSKDILKYKYSSLILLGISLRYPLRTGVNAHSKTNRKQHSHANSNQLRSQKTHQPQTSLQHSPLLQTDLRNRADINSKELGELP
jgi:hypothetical protein